MKFIIIIPDKNSLRRSEIWLNGKLILGPALNKYFFDLTFKRGWV